MLMLSELIIHYVMSLISAITALNEEHLESKAHFFLYLI